MPRFYATIECSIWDDPEFIALGAGAQRTYFMLVTQNDIHACGTLPLTLRRWAKTCTDKDLEAWLAELDDARFVLVDEDTEELLVRTFAKYDGGYKHAVRAKAVVATAKAIRSERLQVAAAAELAKLGLSGASPEPPDRDRSGSPEPVESQRLRVTEVSTDHTPEAFEPVAVNLEREPSAPSGPPSMYCPDHPTGTTEACGPCGTARLIYRQWAENKLAGEVDAKAAAAKARRECDLCDDLGIREHPTTGMPQGRCDHRRSA